jgi:hypothetical protein
LPDEIQRGTKTDERLCLDVRTRWFAIGRRYEKKVIYVPISAEIPDTSQREKLLPLVGSYVEITGEMFQRSGLRTIVIAQIKRADDTGVTSKK